MKRVRTLLRSVWAVVFVSVVVLNIFPKLLASIPSSHVLVLALLALGLSTAVVEFAAAVNADRASTSRPEQQKPVRLLSQQIGDFLTDERLTSTAGRRFLLWAFWLLALAWGGMYCVSLVGLLVRPLGHVVAVPDIATAILTIAGFIGAVPLWFAMLRFWSRFDHSARWSRGFWLAVMLVGLFLGGAVYYVARYRPMIKRLAVTET